jgi:hypothetical protein
MYRVLPPATCSLKVASGCMLGWSSSEPESPQPRLSAAATVERASQDKTADESAMG